MMTATGNTTSRTGTVTDTSASVCISVQSQPLHLSHEIGDEDDFEISESNYRDQKFRETDGQRELRRQLHPQDETKRKGHSATSTMTTNTAVDSTERARLLLSTMREQREHFLPYSSNNPLFPTKTLVSGAEDSCDTNEIISTSNNSNNSKSNKKTVTSTNPITSTVAVMTLSNHNQTSLASPSPLPLPYYESINQQRRQKLDEIVAKRKSQNDSSDQQQLHPDIHKRQEQIKPKYPESQARVHHQVVVAVDESESSSSSESSGVTLEISPMVPISPLSVPPELFKRSRSSSNRAHRCYHDAESFSSPLPKLPLEPVGEAETSLSPRSTKPAAAPLKSTSKKLTRSKSNPSSTSRRASAASWATETTATVTTSSDDATARRKVSPSRSSRQRSSHRYTLSRRSNSKSFNQHDNFTSDNSFKNIAQDKPTVAGASTSSVILLKDKIDFVSVAKPHSKHGTVNTDAFDVWEPSADLSTTKAHIWDSNDVSCFQPQQIEKRNDSNTTNHTARTIHSTFNASPRTASNTKQRTITTTTPNDSRSNRHILTSQPPISIVVDNIQQREHRSLSNRSKIKSNTRRASKNNILNDNGVDTKCDLSQYPHQESLNNDDNEIPSDDNHTRYIESKTSNHFAVTELDCPFAKASAVVINTSISTDITNNRSDISKRPTSPTSFKRDSLSTRQERKMFIQELYDRVSVPSDCTMNSNRRNSYTNNEINSKSNWDVKSMHVDNNGKYNGERSSGSRQQQLVQHRDIDGNTQRSNRPRSKSKIDDVSNSRNERSKTTSLSLGTSDQMKEKRIRNSDIGRQPNSTFSTSSTASNNEATKLMNNSKRNTRNDISEHSKRTSATAETSKDSIESSCNSSSSSSRSNSDPIYQTTAINVYGDRNDDKHNQKIEGCNINNTTVPVIVTDESRKRYTNNDNNNSGINTKDDGCSKNRSAVSSYNLEKVVDAPGSCHSSHPTSATTILATSSINEDDSQFDHHKCLCPEVKESIEMQMSAGAVRDVQQTLSSQAIDTTADKNLPSQQQKKRHIQLSKGRHDCDEDDSSSGSSSNSDVDSDEEESSFDFTSSSDTSGWVSTSSNTHMTLDDTASDRITAESSRDGSPRSVANTSSSLSPLSCGNIDKRNKQNPQQKSKKDTHTSNTTTTTKATTTTAKAENSCSNEVILCHSLESSLSLESKLREQQNSLTGVLMLSEWDKAPENDSTNLLHRSGELSMTSFDEMNWDDSITLHEIKKDDRNGSEHFTNIEELRQHQSERQQDTLDIDCCTSKKESMLISPSKKHVVFAPNDSLEQIVPSSVDDDGDSNQVCLNSSSAKVVDMPSENVNSPALRESENFADERRTNEKREKLHNVTKHSLTNSKRSIVENDSYSKCSSHSPTYKNGELMGWTLYPIDCCSADGIESKRLDKDANFYEQSESKTNSGNNSRSSLRRDNDDHDDDDSLEFAQTCGGIYNIALKSGLTKEALLSRKEPYSISVHYRYSSFDQIQQPSHSPTLILSEFLSDQLCSATGGMSYIAKKTASKYRKGQTKHRTKAKK